MTTSSNGRERWLLFIHQLPGEPAYLRVKVGRRLARVGAVALKNSVYVLPLGDAQREDFSWIRREIVDDGGDASVFAASAVEGLTNDDIERAFRAARAKDFDEIARELSALKAATKPKAARDRQAVLAGLARLEEQLSAVERVDFFPSGAAEGLRTQCAALRAEVEHGTNGRPSKELAQPLHVADYQGRTWVTRIGVKVDRVACAWLIRRFIDQTAKFKFIDPGSYEHRGQELRFDMSEGEFTHEGDLCSFELLCRRFGLEQRGLSRIAEIVHDLDVKDGRYQHPETEGVRVFIAGLVAQHARDKDRIEAASTLFDALLVAGTPATVGNKAAPQRGGKNGRSRAKST